MSTVCSGSTSACCCERCYALKWIITYSGADLSAYKYLEILSGLCYVQFGQVNNVIIPRPTAPGTPAPSGLGRVIVEFADDNGCTAAYRVLNGRRFGGRTVVATYLPEQSYMAGQFDI